MVVLLCCDAVSIDLPTSCRLTYFALNSYTIALPASDVISNDMYKTTKIDKMITRKPKTTTPCACIAGRTVR